jgi:hypothetical protein
LLILKDNKESCLQKAGSKLQELFLVHVPNALTCKAKELREWEKAQ